MRVPWVSLGLLVVFLALPAGLFFFKLSSGSYHLDTLAPAESYSVSTYLSVTGHGDSLTVETYLPSEGNSIQIEDERIRTDLRGRIESRADGNRVAVWSDSEIWGKHEIEIDYVARAQALRFEIDPALPLPAPETGPDVDPTPEIQAEDPEIAALLQELVPEGAGLEAALRSIYQYCDSLPTVSFKGTTDALTALRLGEASCNGKSRLFAALTRHLGLPTRLVGGLILQPGSKRTSHQWVEVRIGPYWVPFCPTNHHFAFRPANYLPLYRGDEVLFRYTRDVNFDYRFDIARRLSIRPELIAAGAKDPLNLMSVWDTFVSAGISIGMLKVLLTVPLAALVLVLLRNVFGLRTFGTFLPLLMAIAAREVGLVWGLVLFVLLIGFISIVRLGVVRLRLLHLPQMAVLLTASVIGLLLFGFLGIRSGRLELANVGLFPIAILAITTERFSTMLEESGWIATLKMAAGTLVGIVACHLVLHSAAFQILFLSFPELILIVVFCDIWVGRWTGLRVSEHWRFRHLIRERAHV